MASNRFPSWTGGDQGVVDQKGRNRHPKLRFLASLLINHPCPLPSRRGTQEVAFSLIQEVFPSYLNGIGTSPVAKDSEYDGHRCENHRPATPR